MKLILAKKESGFLYPINDFIQNQNKENFYYSSMILNCLYDCEYCLLQGMHQSAYMLIFVNTDDFFQAISTKLLNLKSMFLSISYESDLLGIEHVTSLVSSWIEFANKEPKLCLELRSKSANFKKISHLYNPNMILSWSLSPQIIIDNFEHKTANLSQRIKSINDAIALKWKVSIVIDPILDVPNAKSIYTDFINFLNENIDFSKIESVILGTFRMNSDYLKNIQKTKLKSSLLYYPYEVQSKKVSYSDEIKSNLINLCRDNLSKNVQQIYIAI